MSRSHSRVSMDWRANSASRSRSRAPGPIRLDFDPLDQNETHSRALLADLEEEGAVSAVASSGGLPIHRGEGGNNQQECATDGFAGVSGSAAEPMPASNGSSNQSLLSLHLQCLHKPGETDADGGKRAGSVSRPQLQDTMPLPQFQPPNPFQNPQYNAIFMPSSLPTFPHIADPFSKGSNETANGTNNSAFPPHRVLSHGQLSAGRQRKTSFDHTVVTRQDEPALSDADLKPLSPVLSNSSLVRGLIPHFCARF